MTSFWTIVWAILGIGSLIAFGIMFYRLRKSSQRISRSIDPIDQKIKGLRLEVSALRRSRYERQRRLKQDK